MEKKTKDQQSNRPAVEQTNREKTSPSAEPELNPQLKTRNHIPPNPQSAIHNPQSSFSKPVILVVDDEEAILKVLNRALSASGHETQLARRGDEALKYLEADPDRVSVILLDLKMPGPSGMEVLRRVRLQYPEIEVIMMTGFGTMEQAVEAVRLGAYDFLTKPFDPIEKVSISVEKALEHRALVLKTQKLEAEAGKPESFAGLIGQSPKMLPVYQLTERLAATDTTVLIQGESGTGKELVAKALHSLSPRKSKPFIPFNCSAITESLFESELFGHEKGSFTGANTRRAGFFEAANGGTIFLDEVAEIPFSIQAKLLRALQEGEIRRVGGNESIKVDVRVIAASNKDLSRAVAEKKFREDLFYRLSVVTIHLPPLRERAEDIPLLTRHYLTRSCRKIGPDQKQISPEAMKIILDYPWPGNVRELASAIEHAVIVQKGETILPSDLPPAILSRELKPLRKDDEWGELVNLGYKEAKSQALDRFHQVYFGRLLSQADGNMSEAARKAELDRSNFRRIMKSSGVKYEEELTIVD